MEEKLLAIYEKEDDYHGHSLINHYNWYTELRCYFWDRSEDRELGIMENGKPVPDYYIIRVYNYKGEWIANYHFTDRDSANEGLMNIMQNNKGFKRVK